MKNLRPDELKTIGIETAKLIKIEQDKDKDLDAQEFGTDCFNRLVEERKSRKVAQ